LHVAPTIGLQDTDEEGTTVLGHTYSMTVVTSWWIWNQPHPCEDFKSHSVTLKEYVAYNI